MRGTEKAGVYYAKHFASFVDNDLLDSVVNKAGIPLSKLLRSRRIRIGRISTLVATTVGQARDPETEYS